MRTGFQFSEDAKLLRGVTLFGKLNVVLPSLDTMASAQCDLTTCEKRRTNDFAT